MMSFHLLFAAAAIVCFGLDAAGVPSERGFTPLGLVFLTIALLVLT